MSREDWTLSHPGSTIYEQVHHLSEPPRICNENGSSHPAKPGACGEDAMNDL